MKRKNGRVGPKWNARVWIMIFYSKKNSKIPQPKKNTSNNFKPLQFPPILLFIFFLSL